jgi:hypothetical protein
VVSPKEIRSKFLFFTPIARIRAKEVTILAKSHYSVKKRRKELARKIKQEQKRQRKLDKDKINSEETPDPSQDEIENLQA